MRSGRSASVSLSDTRLLQEDAAELAAKLALEKEEDKQRTLEDKLALERKRTSSLVQRALEGNC